MFENILWVILSSIIAIAVGYCVWKYALEDRANVEMNPNLFALLAGILSAFLAYYCGILAIFIWIGSKIFMACINFVMLWVDFIVDVYLTPTEKHKKRRRRRVYH